MNVYMLSSGDIMLPEAKRCGAIEPYVYGLAKELRHSNSVDVYSRGQGEEKANNLHIRTYTYKPAVAHTMKPLFSNYVSLNHLFLSAYFFKDILSVSKRKPIDILHLHNTSAAPVLPLCKFITHAPAVCSVHSYYRPVFLIERFDKLLPVSEYMKQYLILQKGVPEEKIDVLPIAINPQEWAPTFEKEKAKKQLGLQGYKIVLFVGRKCSEKGPEVLIEAMQSIVRSNPDVVAVLIGPDYWHDSPENSYTKFLLTKAKNLNVAQNVIFKMRVDDVTLKQFYDAADVLAMPSIWQEPFGKVIIEAMACEKPVVATRVGGIPEIITSGKDGLLVPPNDPDALANAISLILNDAELAASLGRSAKAKVESNFSFKIVAEKCQKIYESLL